ncbi:MAG: hypothetical protein GXO48_02095 [Chlorobi bacterium]|nr:hypothetical protein [Chlorobiota bacterium]
MRNIPFLIMFVWTIVISAQSLERKVATAHPVDHNNNALEVNNENRLLREMSSTLLIGPDPGLFTSDFGFYNIIPVNSNFACQPFFNYDEGNYNSNRIDTVRNTAQWAEWAITALADLDSQLVYPYNVNNGCFSYVIDSFGFFYAYSNPANKPDTLVLQLLVGNNVLWSDTIFNLYNLVRPETDDLFDTPSIMILPVGVTLDTPPGIARFRFMYYAPKDSAAFGFRVLYKSVNSCGHTNCPGVDFDKDIPVKGTLRYKSKYPHQALCGTILSTDSRNNLPPFFFDCNGNGQYDQDQCEDYVPVPQTFAFIRLINTNYPLTLDADIQTPDNKRIVCAGEAINVEATPGFDSYTWSGPGASGTTNVGTINISPASVVTNPDTFVITVTGQGAAIGCSSSDQLTVVAYNAPPIANFVLNATPGDPTITVDNTSLYGVNCVWDWGDGNLSTVCEPFAYTYGSLGEYTITLIVSNPCGSDTIQRTAVLTSNPIAASASLTYFHRNNTVVIEGLPMETTHILFTDAMGRTVKTVSVQGKKEVEIEINDLPSQLYNVVIMSKEGRLGMFRFTK